ncbi:heparin lyase I family protein [Mycolicibacterium parafortuitum]|uniref:heparin lyase I family protein n=1 Tax=Mycolicibacterium parafortuitum TaxID=39692 RepID=UPI0009F5B23E|nr:heparin lyase I family protein [Mycolicibacterium parafortuitum]
MRRAIFSRLALTAITIASFVVIAPPTAVADRARFEVDSKPMELYAASVPYALSIPAPNLYRFEVHQDDFGFSGDSKNAKRRSEFVSKGERYGAGSTLWTSFSFVVGPAREPFNGGSKQNIIHQWHSVDTTKKNRAPVVRVELIDGNLEIRTESDQKIKGGPQSVVRYRAMRPTDGLVHNLVISGRLGRDGHLNAWLDGNQIVSADAPIGYYEDDNGKAALAYPHWGLYQTNVKDPSVIYLANLEWGTDSLSHRIKSPRPVKKPEDGWK